jgi:hypothetical protein
METREPERRLAGVGVECETYERQRDKLNEQIVLADMQERDAKLEAYDVEAVLAFVEKRHPQRRAAVG